MEQRADSSKVAGIGLGNMGSALAEALLGFYERSLAAGYGAKEQSALFELMIRRRDRG